MADKGYDRLSTKGERNVLKLEPKLRGDGTLKAAYHSDGRMLYLVVTPGSKKLSIAEQIATAKRSWVLIYRSPTRGGEREMGLGALADVPLHQARRLRDTLVTKIKVEKIDPLDEAAEMVRGVASKKTFREIFDALLEARRRGWKEGHRDATASRRLVSYNTWRNEMERHVMNVKLPTGLTFGDTDVGKIDKAAVHLVLDPIMDTIRTTAKRCMSHIRDTLERAEQDSCRPEGKNPASWKDGLRARYPIKDKQIKKRIRRASLSYEEIPAFVTKLHADGYQNRSALAVEFLMLTVVRTSNVIYATWRQIDFEKKCWTIPAENLKGELNDNVDFKVPLSSRALAILKAQHPGGITNPDAYVFPGRSRGRPLSPTTMLELAKRRGGEITNHGWRSAFTAWARAQRTYDKFTIEMAKQHWIDEEVAEHISREVMAAYDDRSFQAYAERVVMMEDWAIYCTTGRQPANSNVVPAAARASAAA